MSANRMTCANGLKQIALARHNCHDVCKSFSQGDHPPSGDSRFNHGSCFFPEIILVRNLPCDVASPDYECEDHVVAKR